MRTPERLEALQRSGLLSKTSGQRLYHLAFTSCTLLQADACQINALDAELQHTVTGYPENPSGWRDVPVHETGCREVVLLGAPLIIPDVREHPIMCKLPWAEHWQGYLGVPVAYDRQTVGSVCVLTRLPREWRSYEATALEGISRLISASLEQYRPPHSQEAS